ncbi:MAG TPA: DUF5399 family protein [Chlamydiales bacterium]|nr:DUF5399 family protein [Chlamydiales bacterium]
MADKSTTIDKLNVSNRYAVDQNKFEKEKHLFQKADLVSEQTRTTVSKVIYNEFDALFNPELSQQTPFAHIEEPINFDNKSISYFSSLGIIPSCGTKEQLLESKKRIESVSNDNYSIITEQQDLKDCLETIINLDNDLRHVIQSSNKFHKG